MSHPGLESQRHFAAELAQNGNFLLLVEYFFQCITANQEDINQAFKTLDIDSVPIYIYIYIYVYIYIYIYEH